MNCRIRLRSEVSSVKSSRFPSYTRRERPVHMVLLGKHSKISVLGNELGRHHLVGRNKLEIGMRGKESLDHLLILLWFDGACGVDDDLAGCHVPCGVGD